MSLRGTLGLATLGVWGSVGCDRAEFVVSDTEGRSFAVLCRDPEKPCSLRQRSGPSSEGGGAVLRREGHLVGVCDGLGHEQLGSCRPLICEQDAECPRGPGSSTGTCIGSLCVEPSHPMSSEDAVMLCLSGTGLGRERADQVARYALGVNCGTPCQIPAPCKRP